MHAILDAEVLRLMACYRATPVLCYFHGMTVEEAAREMGCPRDTVLSRLKRALEKLRRQLARRGAYCPIVGVLATTGAVSAQLSQRTAELVFQMMPNGTATIPDNLTFLAQGAIRTMFFQGTEK